MDENDRKTRKQWLITFALSLTYSTAQQIFMLLVDPSFGNGPVSRYVSGLSSLFGVAGFGFALYHCIYKKPGTKLLLFCLILTAVSALMNPFLYLTGRLATPYIPYPEIYLLLSEGLGIWWWIICWKMRKTNQRLQRNSRGAG